MDIISLILAIIALALALLTRARTGELDRIQNEIYGKMHALEGEVAELKAEMNRMKFARLKAGGEPVFNKDMKIHDAIKMHPDAQSVFASFHLGGCSACAVGENETIEQGTLSHEVDMEKLLAALNELQ